jgi:zinc-binding alcohol dehydrogenase family protein
MKAIGVYHYQPAEASDCFAEVELGKPNPTGKDLLVRVKAVSVNPVDYKVRSSIQQIQDSPRILGWDAAGVVEDIGEDASLFQVGDEVYYAGSIARPGSNSEYQLVDERIVGHKPTSFSFEEAAALPLTAITSWEALFERLGVEPHKTPQNRNSIVLIIGGAGGVGSMAIQLARQVAGLQVIATASRPKSIAWCQYLGADHCINHHEPFPDQLKALGIQEIDYILCFNDTDLHFPTMAEVIKPQGKICSVVENKAPLDMNRLKNKSVTFAWEFMFTKSMYSTEDIQSQHEILDRVADLVDQGILKTTLTETIGPLTPENLAKAHAELESGKTIGKIVLSGISV